MLTGGNAVLSATGLLRRRVLSCLALSIFLVFPLAGRQARAYAGTPVFIPLEPGLELAQAVVRGGPDDREALFTMLRIDPLLHTFTLCMASEEGRARSLPDWSAQRDLRAGINASMYLPDGITSTGYMRNGESVNNENAGPRLGAFFAAGPHRRAGIAPGKATGNVTGGAMRNTAGGATGDTKGDAAVHAPGDAAGNATSEAARLCPERPGGVCGQRGAPSAAFPAACILERDAPGMPGILEEYAVVVQNFRFMDKEGNALWPEGGRAAGMAVVAEDEAGRILFILCRDALTAERFAAALKDFSLALRTVMYVEGGAQAGIFLRVDNARESVSAAGFAGASSFPAPDGMVYVWKGRSSLLNADGDPRGALPNVLAVQRRR
ncbi:MAG: hypothetical protein LBR82_09850 [Desulfovibrio sp.]|jgi:hypothetical protein|nr:hypothetical protein [Desulfovibrio sp.]